MKFVIVQDQDSADCVKLKKSLLNLCAPTGRDVLIRIACKELEAWYFGDLAAVSKAYNRDLTKLRLKRKYKIPDKIENPKDELRKLIPIHQQIAGARLIGPLINIEQNTSHSFQSFVAGVKRICEYFHGDGKAMDLINELMNCLSNIDYSILDEDYIYELLDSRESTPFDTEWCRVDKEINALKNDENYTDEIKNAQGKIREKAFMIVAQNAGSELSAYISDDFGLIYDSLVLSYKDEWLDKLMEKYKNKSVPAGEL